MDPIAYEAIHEHCPTLLKERKRCSLSARITSEQCSFYQSIKSPSCANCLAVIEINGVKTPSFSTFLSEREVTEDPIFSLPDRQIAGVTWTEEAVRAVVLASSSLKELMGKYNFHKHTVKRWLGKSYQEIKMEN